jgi:hypothetical protein
MPVEGGAPACDVLATVWKVSGIGDEPDNRRKDRDAPAQALCEGQGGAWLLLRRRHKVRSRGSRQFSTEHEDRKVIKLGRKRGGTLHAFV